MLGPKFARIAGLILLLMATSAMGDDNSNAPLPANPLLEKTQFPDFKSISAAHFAPAIDTVLQQYNDKLSSIVRLPSSWDNTVQPLEEETNNVTRVWNLISHLNAVNGTDEIKAAYNTLLPKVVGFYSTVMNNIELYQAYSIIKSSTEYDKFSDVKKSVITQILLNFKLNGADLSADKKERYKQIYIRLQDLSNTFSKNLSDAINSWQYPIPPENKAMLDQLPDSIKNVAAKKASSLSNPGWILTLDDQCLTAIISFAKNRDLRKTIYTAFSTLASDQDPDPTRRKFDNGPIIVEMLSLRQELASILGFNSFAEFSLADKEVQSTDTVMTFLNDLAIKSKKTATAELTALTQFATEKDKIPKLEAWDIPYYAELYKQQYYAVSQEDTRKYFSEENVFKGLFDTVNILYGINIQEIKNPSVWDSSVRLFAIQDRNNVVRGYFYTDLYARNFKTNGSWMSSYLSRLRFSDGTIQLPVAFIETNFLPGQPGLLTHNNVITFFGEFGSMLQHVLSLIDYPSISGANGVALDAKQLANKFMQNWAWQKEVINDISKNISSGEALPDNIFEGLLAVRNFDAGMSMLSQVEFAMLDFRLYLNQASDKNKSVQYILNDIHKQIAVVPVPDSDRLPNRFEEIFAGNFAAGYYGFKWSEVLARDAFSEFQESGIFNAQIGTKFLNTFLEEGGEKSTLDLFVEFRGREPSVIPLLKEYGIVDAPEAQTLSR